MGSLVNYDTHYEKGLGQCGDPFPEIVRFFDAYEGQHATVLDLGCGQGRDALMAARRGHRVLGVDISEVGLKQLRGEAAREGLDIDVARSDVVDFKTRRRFDIVILDRVLHLLLSDEERLAALTNACRLARSKGVVLVADGPKHSPSIQRFFKERSSEWRTTKRTRRFLFAQRIPVAG